MKNKKMLPVIVFYIVVGLTAVYYFASGNQSSVPASLFATAGLEGEFDLTEPESIMQEQTEPVSAGAEETSERISETDTESEEKEYSFTTTNKITILYVRETPSLSGEIIGRLQPGTKGDVLELGEEWSYITDGKVTGYSYNQYLDIQEKK